MGLDLLDITWRLEKRFDLTIDKSESVVAKLFGDGVPGECDATAGALHDWIRERCRRAGRPVPSSSWTRVKLTLAEVLLVAPDEIRPESRLVEDLGMS